MVNILGRNIRSPIALAIVGVAATLMVALVVVAFLLLTASSLSDNAALIGALVALGGVATTQMVSTALASERAREEAIQNYFDRMGVLLAQYADQLRNHLDLKTQLDYTISKTKIELERKKSDFENTKLPRYREWQKYPNPKPADWEGGWHNPEAAKRSEEEDRRELDDLQRNIRELETLKMGFGSDTRTQLRAHTLAVLDQVGNRHKRLIMRFLHDTRLIKNGAESNVGEAVRGEVIDANEGYGIELHDADFGGADLTRLALSQCNLRRVHFKGANLRGADLRESDLAGADLAGADLRESDLAGADLTDASVTDSQLAMVISLKGTTLPNGSRHN